MPTACCFEIDSHGLAATITNCAFRNRHRWNAALNLWAFGKWMVLHHLFCMGNDYFRGRSFTESHCLWSDSYLSAETEKGFNMDCCRFNRDAPRSCGFVENGLTNQWSEPRTLFSASDDVPPNFQSAEQLILCPVKSQH